MARPDLRGASGTIGASDGGTLLPRIRWITVRSAIKIIRKALAYSPRSRGPRGFFCLQVDRRGPVIADVMWLKFEASFFNI